MERREGRKKLECAEGCFSATTTMIMKLFDVHPFMGITIHSPSSP
jgi:hypothetical protein